MWTYSLRAVSPCGVTLMRWPKFWPWTSANAPGYTESWRRTLVLCAHGLEALKFHGYIDLARRAADDGVNMIIALKF
ncbi:hypothetical protein DEDE109153_08245 [Deinococcus deserti]